MRHRKRDRWILASLVVVTASCSEAESEEQTGGSRQMLGAKDDEPSTQTTGDFQWKARQPRARTYTGDFNGDGKSDLAINQPNAPGLGFPTFGDLWIGTSNGAGFISVSKFNQNTFSASSAMLVGDYNGDGRDDLFNLFPGSYVPPYSLIAAIGRSDGAGNFEIISAAMPQAFLDQAATSGARRISCDINGDGRDDVVLTGASGWTTIPVAFSNGDGTFSVTNLPATNFPSWATTAGSQLACDDFNGDGRDDLLLIGGVGWNSVPIAFSNGDGTFNVVARIDSFFPMWATNDHAQLVTGDFTGDGQADILLTGSASWGVVIVGVSEGIGTFGVALSSTYNLHLWAAEPQSMARGGDFNGDGLDDFTLLGGADYWYTLPIGFSNGDTTFTTYNQPVP